MTKVFIEELATQKPEVQHALQQQITSIKTKDIGKDGIVRLVVQGIVYIGQLVLTGNRRVYKHRKCERLNGSIDASDATVAPSKTPAKRAPRKSAPKKSATATKRAKRSSK